MVRLPTAAPAIVALFAMAVCGHVDSAGEQLRRSVDVGNAACAACHKSIYDSYSTTAMARTSGPALPNLIEGSFYHSPSDVSYGIERRGEVGLLSYQRSGTRQLRGEQRLKYHVGSNTRGRTFLFEIEGFLYQSPINYYAVKDRWDMSPGYAQLVEMELNHPVDSTCLFCHASRVQRPVIGTVNKFAGDAFLQPGVGCERCHGPGSDHVKGLGPMVNPAKLTGDRRDSVCNQCHLEGEARIARAGRAQDLYTPGESLSDSLAVFVRDDAAIDRLGAVSHVEALALSLCKRRSGDGLSCITCHDPHVQPGASQKASYYRARCIGCHAPLARNHHPDQQDCTTCHMPRSDSADIGHTMVTDHRIPRLEVTPHTTALPVRRLVEFGSQTPRDRELGLAYGEVALRGNEFAAREALRLLQGVLPRFEHDPDVLTRLGHLYQMQGDLDRAERFYERALTQAPQHAVVAGNLGVLNARRGNLRHALELWRDAFARNPQLSDLGLNLANGLCAVGDADGARAVAARVLEHNPDHGATRTLLRHLTDGSCPQQ
jgi:hypothetical protein